MNLLLTDALCNLGLRLNVERICTQELHLCLALALRRQLVRMYLPVYIAPARPQHEGRATLVIVHLYPAQRERTSTATE